MYSKKTIQNLKPDWYSNLSKKEKLEIQNEMKKNIDEMWLNKPNLISRGTYLVSKNDKPSSLTKGKKYCVLNHFCTLVTTIYYSEWKQFITLKNDNGYTVKMNLQNFEKLKKGA